MTISEIQALLASVGRYTGGIDGVSGPKTRAAVAGILGQTGSRWSASRRLIAAAQTVLNNQGHNAGTVDGYAGHNTREAYAAWLYRRIHGKAEVVERNPVSSMLGREDLPRQRDVDSFYGRPGPEIQSRLMIVNAPIDLRIDYNLRQRTRRITVHQKCGPALLAALTAVHKEYGTERMRALGIDRYAGAHNHRTMRGDDNTWSMHAYGCAIDFYAAPNGLRMKCPQALFCHDHYKPFLDIMEAHGWLPAIRLWGKDAMHFQMARL